ncbi:MAG: hypothetical protein ACP5O1_07850 [Phycisphaerae bacterium]
MSDKPLMCPTCATHIDSPHGLSALVSKIQRAHVRCHKCGRTTHPKDAQIMSTSYQHWFGQFRLQLEAAVGYLPHLELKPAVEVLKPKHFDDDVHHLHTFRELLDYTSEVFRPVFRDRALGYDDAELTISPLNREGSNVAMGLRLYGHCGHNHEQDSWTLLITRYGPRGFMTYLTTGHTKHPHPEVATKSVSLDGKPMHVWSMKDHKPPVPAATH